MNNLLIGNQRIGIAQKRDKKRTITMAEKKEMKKQNKRKVLFVFWVILIVSVLILIFFFIVHKSAKFRDNSPQISNPASVYCIDNGGNIEIKTNPEGGQYGICMKNEKECEEWAYFRGECSL